MKISFVIPAYNEEKLLPKCLESIERELRGGVYDAEIIVVNNASTDSTARVARSFENVRVVDEPRKGLTWARQAGYKASSGEIIANVDADTMLTPDWIAKAIQAFTEDKNLVALTGPFIYYDLNVFERALVKIWYFPGWLFHALTQTLLKRATMLQGGNFVLRRDAWEKAGGFDTTISFYGEDADVARRISKYGHVRWTWNFPMYASGRRLNKEGLLMTGLRYGSNLFSTHITGRPMTDAYTDIRQ